MPKQAVETEAEVLETPEIVEEVEQAEAEAPAETEEQTEQPAAEDDGEDEVSISFGDEEEEEAAEDETPTIKRLRERNREQTKLLRDREKRIAELEQGTAQPVEVGAKPTLESCDWDEAKFETELDTWKERKAAAEAQVETAEAGKRQVIESYNRDLQAYAERKTSLGVADYEEAEATVVSALSMEQQAVALQAAKDPAALVYALSKSPAKLAELAKEHNPWKLSAAIARMEGSVKVVTRKKAPNIDRPAKGSASMQTNTADEHLEKLEKEAAETGIRTKVIEYKRSLRAKGK